MAIVAWVSLTIAECGSLVEVGDAICVTVIQVSSRVVRVSRFCISNASSVTRTSPATNKTLWFLKSSSLSESANNKSVIPDGWMVDGMFLSIMMLEVGIFRVIAYCTNWE